MNQIARKARLVSGVGHVHGPYRYYETQRVYDSIRSSLPSDKKVLVGYSCGGNASLAVAQGLAQSNIPVHILAMQPSLWCGWYLPTTSNVVYAQSTYASCIGTLGLGCMRFYGNAQENVNIFRPEGHLRADTDPAYQRDVMSAIYRIANPRGCDPRRHQCHAHTLVVHRAPGGGVSHTLVHHDQ